MLKKEIFNPHPIPDEAYTNGNLWDYKLGDYDNAIVAVYVNDLWRPIPAPSDGIKQIISSFVDAPRNIKAEVIGKQIGKPQIKIDNYVIPLLYVHEWQSIMNYFVNTQNIKCKFFSLQTGNMVVREMYVSGDRTAEYFGFRQKKVSGETLCRPEVLRNCSINFIDTGRTKW